MNSELAVSLPTRASDWGRLPATSQKKSPRKDFVAKFVANDYILFDVAMADFCLRVGWQNPVAGADPVLGIPRSADWALFLLNTA